ncbi:DUF7333 family protein [Haladaptatus salinisoli]|uniref:DUF7333 family protein n=1 Tax=Haladaptatus salinisoli TaxID=2884876 RepID=UPI001D0AEE2B|nr:hypothetical protein [Haladaptatus salinisoli]
MKFDEVTTAVAFLVLLAIVLGGTLTSGMPQTISMMVSGGLVVFGVLVLALGVKHGEHRASR